MWKNKWKVSNRHTEVQQEIYVVRGLNQALAGRRATEGLGLVVKVEPVQSYKEGVILKFPHLFSGLGKLEGAYTIALNEDAKPHALKMPRRIAIPLLPKVKAGLQWIEDMGVISRVEEPTDWCAGIVFVPKPMAESRSVWT